MSMKNYLTLAATMAIPMVIPLALATPAHAQSTTLTGSVLQRATVVNVQEPKLQARTPQFDARASSNNTPPRTQPARAARPRVITRTVYVEKRDDRTYFQKHPKVKSALVGAGVGAGAGAVTGLIARRGILRGSAIGAGTGAGIGLIRSSQTMRRHPIIKNTTTGAVAGLGFGAAASRRGGTVAKSAAVGTAIGLGYSLFKKLR